MVSSGYASVDDKFSTAMCFWSALESGGWVEKDASRREQAGLAFVNLQRGI